MIDIHILVHSAIRKEWLAECLESLEGQSCCVRVLKGIDGNIGAGRERGYSLGCNPYVGFIDADDKIRSGFIAETMSQVVSLGCNAAVTLEDWLVRDRIIRSNMPFHHMLVAKRPAIEYLLPVMRRMPTDVDRVGLRALRPIQLQVSGYVWRLDGAGSRRFNSKKTLEEEGSHVPLRQIDTNGSAARRV